MPIRLETPSFMSAVWKEGYNRSILGLVNQLNGGEKYDLSGFQGGVLFDVAASIASFGFDLPAYVAGGGIGGAAFKQVAKTGAKEAVKRHDTFSVVSLLLFTLLLLHLHGLLFVWVHLGLLLLLAFLTGGRCH